MADRLERLRSRLAQLDLDAVLVSQDENRRWLSGFSGSAGYLLISRERAILATDFRYVEQAKSQAPSFDVVQVQGAPPKWLPTQLSALEIRSLGIEGGHMPFRAYQEMVDAVTEAGPEVRFVPTEGLVEELRAVKDEVELELIEEAAGLSDAALEEVVPRVRPGLSERALAWELESFMRRNGSESLPFDIIVASGPNSALPHAKPTDRIIQGGEPVVIDLGAKVGGYCSDITRTICLEEADNTFHRIYDIVLGAQLTALSVMRAGMTGEQIDRLARTVIVQAGYGDNFGHGLGHGLGLAGHEEPRLGTGSSDIVTDDMVFTVEPGVYIPGWGGIRIEDMVVMQEGKPRPLTRARKSWRR